MTGIAPRHLTLDFIRGVAVMGILVANLPAFGLPEAAYFSPRAWGGTAPADLIAWFVTFVLVEGKMRGLFTFLFGASMLLVIDRARAAGDSPAQVHFIRMATLFAIGCAHLYLLWWGDILAHYALVGAIAFLFIRLPTRWLVALGVLLVLLQTVLMASVAASLFASAARNTPQAVETWDYFALSFGTPPRAHLLAEIAALGGSFTDGVAWRWNATMSPLAFLPIGGAETLAFMLFGMAAYRSGFLLGSWDRRSYRRIALAGLGIGIIAYAMLGLNTWSHGFDQRWVFVDSIVAGAPLRPVMFVGYTALLVLLLRPGGWLTTRIAAAGRAAFTNYLGTSLIMSAIFAGWGLGWFGQLSRAQLYLLAPPAWLIMVLWSHPWLESFHYGPLEWLWRTLARFERQPFRRGPGAQETATDPQ